MPIRPENKDRYPSDWNEIRSRILIRANHRCEGCGVRNHELGGRTRDGKWHRAHATGDNGMRLTWPKPGDHAACGADGLILRIVRIVLTIAHLDHTPENCAPDNLRAWCQRCHNRYDAKHRRAGIEARARKARAVAELI